MPIVGRAALSAGDKAQYSADKCSEQQVGPANKIRGNARATYNRDLIWPIETNLPETGHRHIKAFNSFAWLSANFTLMRLLQCNAEKQAGRQASKQAREAINWFTLISVINVIITLQSIHFHNWKDRTHQTVIGHSLQSLHSISLARQVTLNHHSSDSDSGPVVNWNKCPPVSDIKQWEDSGKRKAAPWLTRYWAECRLDRCAPAQDNACKLITAPCTSGQSNLWAQTGLNRGGAGMSIKRIRQIQFSIKGQCRLCHPIRSGHRHHLVDLKATKRAQSRLSHA